MKVICYWDDPSKPTYPKELLDRWSSSFRDHGFDPVILTENDARKHPMYQKVCDVVAKTPTVNAPWYQRTTWLRWLAYRAASPAFFTDIDVINYAFTEKDVNTDSPMLSHFTSPSPAVVYAKPVGIDYFLSHFETMGNCAFNYQGKPHLCDMFMFQRCFPGMFTSHCWDSCFPYALEAPLVHFGNGCVKPEWRFEKRHLAVDAFTEERKAKYPLR